MDSVETAATLAEALERLRRRPAPDLMLFDRAADAAGLGRLIERAKAEPGVAYHRAGPPRGSGRRVGAAGRLVSQPAYRPHGLIVEAIAGAWGGERSAGGRSHPPTERAGRARQKRRGRAVAGH